jgi:uncharacterized protein (DUF4415 family)
MTAPRARPAQLLHDGFDRSDRALIYRLWLRAGFDALTDGEIAAPIRDDPDAFEPEPGCLEHAQVVRTARPKRRVTLRLDADLVGWFKAYGPRLPDPHQRRAPRLRRARAQVDTLSQPAPGLNNYCAPIGSICAPPQKSALVPAQSGMASPTPRRRQRSGSVLQ